MKKAFQVLKGRPQIEITVTRDSVCAGDDCDAPHERKIKIHSFVDPAAMAKGASSGYLPTVSITGHSWICLLNGKRVAEIKNERIEPLTRKLTYEEKNEIHFTYRSASY